MKPVYPKNCAGFSGQSLWLFLEARILLPLGMTSGIDLDTHPLAAPDAAGYTRFEQAAFGLRGGMTLRNFRIVFKKPHAAREHVHHSGPCAAGSQPALLARAADLG